MATLKIREAAFGASSQTVKTISAAAAWTKVVMASEDFARKFSLNPPPRGKQFRVEFAKARAAQRRATRKLFGVLKEDVTALPSAEVATDPPRFSRIEFVRVWSSPGMLDLRRSLDPQAEENLRARLEAFMAGQLSQSAWLMTLCSINEARRAADRIEETWPRKWRQTFSSPQGW
jgi:hypothetical protein